VNDWQHATEIAEILADSIGKGGLPPTITGNPAFDRVIARATAESIATWEDSLIQTRPQQAAGNTSSGVVSSLTRIPIIRSILSFCFKIWAYRHVRTASSASVHPRRSSLYF